MDTDNVVQKSGDPGSLFGFSLAMHRQLEPEDRRILLVGAPRATALSGQKSKVTGGLYSCEGSSTGCQRIIFDNHENLNRESKENQWMGVSVSSQGPGGQVVTCAHRYQRRTSVNTPTESRDIIGRCYVLGQDLVVDDTYKWQFCDSRPRGHEMFGSCQQGLSATFDKDYHYLIFGAPGAYNWKGVVRLEQKNDTFIELGIFDDGPFETGDETDKNPDLVPAVPNSYLGFSLDSGMSLTKKGELIVVAGAPRANHSGAVVMLKKGGAKILTEEYTLEGEGLSSSFGYDLAVLDINRDGWQDLVVGAPQYFEKDGEIGGAVYVYINKGGDWSKAEATRIDGPQDSMFGLAVENLGDINLDGYHDFAVGAPNEDEGFGHVHIFHGSATGVNSKKASQVLSGKPKGVKMFGYSLAGNMDLDKNSYPDLAIGSLSDSVFVYRARPVIDIKKEIKFTPSEIDLTKKNCGNAFCLTVEACFSYTASPKNYAPKLMVEYSLEADADHRLNGLIPRATFLDASDSEHNYESKGTITFDGKGRDKCVTRRLAIQENIKDKLRGIPIDVSVNIKEAKRKRRQSSTAQLAPVLDANAPNKTRSEVNFVKEGCGSDNVCQSKLQLTYRYGNKATDDDPFVPLEVENGVPVISLSDQKNIALEIKVTNPNGDDAHEAHMSVLLPSSLTFSAFRNSPTDLQTSCNANIDGSKIDCELGNPFKRDSETTFYLILGTAVISRNISEVEIDLQLNTTSDQQKLAPVKAKAKVAIMLQLLLSGQAQPSQVYFSGKSKGESSVKTESDIGSAITHHFRIINLGRSLTDFGTATLDIDWPKETKDQHWLLYLTKISSTGVDQIQCTPKAEVNSLNTVLSNTRSRRAVGNTQESDQGVISRFTDKKSETLSCDDGAKCVRIRCPLRGLDSNAVITLHSRLWNSTFIDYYPKLHHIEVIVKAALHVDSTSKNTVLKNAETQVRVTVFPERREAQYGGVPWWIIVLSILLGLLLLGLLAFLLWKCGLFGKKNKEDPSEKERLTSNA